MPTVKDQIRTIIEELTRFQTMPAPYLDRDDDFQFLRMISAGSDDSIVVSRKIDDTIAAVADQLMAAGQTLAPKVTRAEWRATVREVFGPALAMIDLDFDPANNADTVLFEVKAALTKHVAGYDVRELVFGCTLFGGASIKPFSFGPVCFEPRSDWLARKTGEGVISTITRRRVNQIWSGRRLRKRKLSADMITEMGILDAIGACPYVCSVKITGLAAQAGREKALTAVRLATASIALLWGTPSRALEGMNVLFDRSIHRQHVLTFMLGNIVNTSSRLSHMPRGPWLKDGEWEHELAKNRDYFRLVGGILNYAIDPSGGALRPNMMNTPAQSLLWFHEACRETVRLMAIVKYSAALDALACGGKAGGIRRLINARLGIPDNRPIRANGPTLKQAVDEIYSDGRSQTIHGVNKRLGHDWSNTRSLAEQFARLCLLACIDWAASHPTTNNPKQLSQ